MSRRRKPRTPATSTTPPNDGTPLGGRSDADLLREVSRRRLAKGTFDIDAIAELASAAQRDMGEETLAAAIAALPPEGDEPKACPKCRQLVPVKAKNRLRHILTTAERGEGRRRRAGRIHPTGRRAAPPSRRRRALRRGAVRPGAARGRALPAAAVGGVNPRSDGEWCEPVGWSGCVPFTEPRGRFASTGPSGRDSKPRRRRTSINCNPTRRAA